MSEHAPLAPSSAEQWGHCSGSVLAQSVRPEPETQQTREGTATHWVASEALTAGTLCVDAVGKKAPNGVVIDRTMAAGAQVYVDDVAAVCEKFNAYSRLLVEHRVYMPRVHPDNWGTLDAGLYLPERRVLFLWDAKFGHRQCRAKGNLQLIDYALGLVQQFEIDGLEEQGVTVVFRIVQPFCYRSGGPVDEWVVKLSDLRGYWNQLQAKAHEAYSKPTLSTGLWCRDCSAVADCSAARQAAYNLIDLANELYVMEAMTSDDLAVERRILSNGLAAAKARLDAIEDVLTHRIQSGESGGGLTLQTGQGRLEWACPPEQAVALVAQFGIDASKPGALTPTQVKAAAPAAIKPMLEQVLKQYTRRPAGALSLVDADESRTARAFKRN